MNSIKSIISICVMVAIAQIGLAHINPNLAPKSNEDNDNSNFNTSLREDCLEAITTTTLGINNVRALLQVGGDVWWDLDNGSYIVPRQESREDEVSAIFSGSVWVGGLTPAGSIKLAAGPNGTYFNRPGAVDWYSGPLTVAKAATDTEPAIIGGVTDKPICEDWNIFFEVDGESVRNAVKLFDKDPLAFDCESILNDVKYWPGKNNPFWGEQYDFELPVDQSLGAFWDEPGVDGNGDGVYNPCDGDFPIINIRKCEPATRKAAFELIPDQMNFWIYNDNGSAHRISFATPIQMEVQVQAFAYKTNDAVNDMTFNRYKLINKGSEDIRETYFAIWVDPDLGCYQDDYIGCDVSRSLAYVYNEDATDGIEGGETCNGVNTYGTNVPILGIDYFRGPRGPKLYCRDMNGNILTEFNEELDKVDTIFCDPAIGSGDFDTLLEIGMSAFMYMNNCGVGDPNAATCDAAQASEFYNIMKGIWLDGTPVTVGGDGYNPGSVDSTNYVFPDDPNDESADAWSMCTADLPFGDRRMLQVTGPLLLQPQATNELIVGVVFVPDEESYPCPDLSRLRTADDLAQSLFDNCFNITDGPDAPDICGIELNQEIIMALFNQSTSNNFGQLYEEEDLQIARVDLTPEEKLYKFEGYQIYQLINGGISPSELDNIDKARIVFQTDLKNGVAELFNWTPQVSPISNNIIYTPEREVVGANLGIKNTLSLKEDQFATGADPKLINHKTYYYMAVAYGFNEYAIFEENTGNGQPRPYIEGRGNIQTYAFTPRPIVYEELLSNYGDVPSLTRVDGVGSGLTFIDMEDDMYDKILEASANGNAANVTYKKNAGPVNVKIYNPLDVVEGSFRLEVIGTELGDNNSTNFLDADARWVLTSLDDNTVIESDTFITIAGEQIVEKYGFSIELNQISEPGGEVEVNNGAVGSTLDYNDVNESNWLTGIPDGGLGNGDRLFDWVANEAIGDEEGQLKNLNSIFYPFTSTRFAAPGENENPFYVTPGWRRGQGFLVAPQAGSGFGDLLLNQDLNNVDIIFTSDKSKWSRCVVVESASTDYDNMPALYRTQGDKTQFDVRSAPSVDKEGNPDGTGDGMGWFPGYAVDVESGERLNVFFSENSIYDEDIVQFLGGEQATGGDMIFNPTSQAIAPEVPEDLGQFGIFNLIGGGQHFIYVTRQKYDACELLFNDLSVQGSPAVKFNPLSLVTWSAFPTLSPGEEFLSVADGLIPNDLKIKLRVSNPFGFATEIDEVGSNNDKYDGAKVGGFPAFEFKIEGAASRALAANEYEGVLDTVNVVPNPYYAYSTYEKSEFDNTVKITNLPPRADITIYSLDGKFIRTFLRDEQDVTKEAGFPVQTQQGFPDVSWDLKNSKGVPVASGVYLIHIRAEFDGQVEERVIKWFGVGRKFDPSNL